MHHFTSAEITLRGKNIFLIPFLPEIVPTNYRNVTWWRIYISSTLSSHRWHSVLRLCTRLSHRPNNNICKPLIARKIVCEIKWRVVIFLPQSYSRSQTAMYDNKSAFCWGHWYNQHWLLGEQQNLLKCTLSSNIIILPINTIRYA